ncbi:hypothetical protein EYV94_19330 [Puteibacter caeruleilacunae]|nr:hypothetical protein EYV94_19330 [Puteibacter caeruleilacunae]
MNKLSNILTIVLGVLLAVSAVLIILMMSSFDDAARLESLIEMNLNWGYLLLIAGAGGALVFSVINVFANPANLKKAIISLVGIAVLIAVAYGLASDAIPHTKTADEMVAEGSLTGSVSKMIGTAIWTTYLLLFGAVGSIIYSSVSRLLKR